MLLWLGEEVVGLPTDWTPWAILLGFVAALGTTVILGLRAVMTGQLVVREVHQEVRSDRDTYRKAAEMALEANRELATNVGALVTTVEKLMAAQAESQLLIRTLVAAQTAKQESR